MENRPSAHYRMITDACGTRYHFYCDLSGAHVCTTDPIQADTPELELKRAWETQGRPMFNQCKKCGRWVSDVMFNADVHECVACAPWEDQPRYCTQCGKKLFEAKKFCSRCGTKLIYEGGEDDD